MCVAGRREERKGRRKEVGEKTGRKGVTGRRREMKGGWSVAGG